MKNYFKILASIVFSIFTLNANAQITNTKYGLDAGPILNTATLENSLFGYKAGFLMQNSVNDNTFLGAYAASAFTKGANNVAVGSSAGGSNEDIPFGFGLLEGSNNVLIGALTFHKARNTNSSENVLLGNYNFYQSKIRSNGNVAIGSYATSGYENNENKSFFILNNQAQRSNPLLFGYFAPNTSPPNKDNAITGRLGSQLAINTTGVKENFALSINGPTFIGSFTSAGTNSTTINATKLDNYKLWVERGVISEDFAVASVNSWADFVFEKDYKLRPLSEVEKFINKNKHLPDVPSAAALKENGASMIEIMKNLTQKVEELTLYAIQQDKQIKALQTQLTATKESKNK